MDLIKYVWNYAGDNRYLLIVLWIIGILLIPVSRKVYRDKVARFVYIIYDILICVVFTVLWFIYFWDKAKMSL